MPKLDMMEDNVVDFIDIWKVGIGMLGEQGAESIHTTFNQLTYTYANMMNDVEWLKCVAMENNRQMFPDNVALLTHPIKKRRNMQDNYLPVLYTHPSHFLSLLFTLFYVH